MLPTHTGGRAARTPRPPRRGSGLRMLVNALALLLPLAALTMLFGGSASLASFLAGRHAARNGSGAQGSSGGVPAPVASRAAAAPRGAAAAPDAGVGDADCGSLVAAWVAGQEARSAERAAAPAPDLTYFLHVPRTAGRTLYFCALKPAFAPSERCARSYDHLRLDPSAPSCTLLGSHDDFRLVETFPAGGATLVTQLRDPVDRLLSAYEFAVEVAARQYGNRKSPPPPRPAGAAPPPPSGAAARRQPTDTHEVWPWNWLVPLMARDMDARAAANPGGFPVPDNAFNSTVVMPLAEFVAHPEVADLLHNGATFQLLGLTNNTVEGSPGADGPTAAALRACARAGGPPADALRALAARRLEEEVAVVLLKERLLDSVATLAAALGRPLTGPSYRISGDEQEAELYNRRLALKDDSDAERAVSAAADDAARAHKPLANAFLDCADDQRRRAAERRARGLNRLRFDDGSHIVFKRADVAPELAYAIAEANSLDVALHAKGVKLFEAQRARLAKQGLLQELRDDGSVHALST